MERQVFRFKPPNQKSKLKKTSLSSAEIGTAHHTFLQFVSLEQAGTLIGLQEEARRMGGTHFIRRGVQLDFDALSPSGNRTIGKKHSGGGR